MKVQNAPKRSDLVFRRLISFFAFDRRERQHKCGSLLGRKALAIIGFAVLMLPAPVLAYGAGEGGKGGGASKTVLSNAVTNTVVRTLRREVDRCQRLPWRYRYDCYRRAYKISAGKIAGNPAYAEARAILIEVEESLAATVQRNVDVAAPRKRQGFQSYRAVKTSARETAKQEFTQALQEAETKLLRAAGNSNTHYAKIAQALNSNKLLIRSAWLFLGDLLRPLA